MSTTIQTDELTNLGRKKSATFAVKVFATAFAMLISGAFTALAMGDGSLLQLLGLSIAIAIAAAFFGLIAYFLGEKIIWKASQRHVQGQAIFGRISIGVILIASIFGALNSYTSINTRRDVDIKEKERVAALTPEQRQAEIEAKRLKEQAEMDAKLEKERSHKEEINRIGFARQVNEALQKSMRDPQSLTVESLMVNKNGTVACIEYRARNGFGGMNRSFAVLENGHFYFDKAEVWNRTCAYASLFDMMFVVK